MYLERLNKLHTWVPPTKRKKKQFITTYVRREVSSYSPHVRPTSVLSSDFYQWVHLKLWSNQFQLKIKTLHQSVFIPVKPFETFLDLLKCATLHDQKFPRVYLYRRRKFWASDVSCDLTDNNNSTVINPLNAELSSICHLLALLGTHHILHVSRIRVKLKMFIVNLLYEL